MDAITLANEFVRKAEENRATIQLTRAYVVPWLPRVSGAQTSDFVKQCAKQSDLQFCERILLCWPELWKAWTIEGWSSISPQATERCDITDWRISDFKHDTCFLDVWFLARWLNIDVVALTVSKNTSRLCQTRILKYCAAVSDYLLFDRESIWGWDDPTGITGAIMEYRRTAASEGATFLQPEMSASKFRDYARKAIGSLDGA